MSPRTKSPQLPLSLWRHPASSLSFTPKLQERLEEAARTVTEASNRLVQGGTGIDFQRKRKIRLHLLITPSSATSNSKEAAKWNNKSRFFVLRRTLPQHGGTWPRCDATVTMLIQRKEEPLRILLDYFNGPSHVSANIQRHCSHSALIFIIPFLLK